MLKKQKVIKSLICILFFSILYTPLVAQLKSSVKGVFVHLKQGEVLYTSNSIIYANNDTVIFLDAEIDYYIRKKTSENHDFYNLVKEKAYQRKWTKELHNLILISSSKNEMELNDSMVTKNSEANFLPFQHLIIREITIRKLNVFGSTISEPEREPKYTLGKIGNRLHIKTKDAIIQNYILFRKNQRVNPFYLAETERLLRELSFIEDAKIIVLPIPDTPDSVDIQLLVKDNWSKGVAVSIPNAKTYSFDFLDNNLFGYGHKLSNTYFSDPNQLPHSGLDGYYQVDNMVGSFLNFRTNYAAFGNKGIQLRLWRDFYTQKTKYAGELKYENFSCKFTPVKNDSTKLWEYFPVSNRIFNVWLGRSFPLNIKLFTSYPSITISAGIYRDLFFNRPYVSDEYHYMFHNKTFYLIGISISSKAYYKSSLIYNFGRTEDIPYGFIINYTHGIEQSEFKSRLYNSVSLIKGNTLNQIGFIYNKIAVGGFMNSKNFEQGVLKVGINFFSNLILMNRFKLRNFVNIDFTKGYNRFIDEYLSINNFSGIRGFYNDSAIGNQRLRSNFETVIFSPYYIAGFRLAFFVYADFAYIGSTSQLFFKNTLYTGLGMGIRFRNEKLIFKTFQIKLAYYPNISDRASGELFAISQEWRFRTEDLSIKSPQIIDFK